MKRKLRYNSKRDLDLLSFLMHLAFRNLKHIFFRILWVIFLAVSSSVFLTAELVGFLR